MWGGGGGSGQLGGLTLWAVVVAEESERAGEESELEKGRERANEREMGRAGGEKGVREGLKRESV